MKTLLKSIFGNSETTAAIVQNVDNAFFTKQEKASYLLQYLAASQPQNLARRIIAVMVVFMWMLLIIVAVAAYKFDPAFSAFVFSTLDNNVNTPFSIIIGFYFAAHLARAWKGNQKNDNDSS